MKRLGWEMGFITTEFTEDTEILLSHAAIMESSNF